LLVESFHGDLSFTPEYGRGRRQRVSAARQSAKMDDVRSLTARDYKQFLRGGRWFSGLPEAFQDRLVESGALRRVAAGQRLFARGEAPSGLYGVLDGAIRISGISEAGKEALLALLEPPSWFGEISVFDEQPRTHDAIADSESLLIEVPQAALH